MNYLFGIAAALWVMGWSIIIGMTYVEEREKSAANPHLNLQFGAKP